MIARISNISEEAKYWLIASVLSLTIITFVITTPGGLDISRSGNTNTQQDFTDRSHNDQNLSSYDVSGSDKYSPGEEVAYRDRPDGQVKDRQGGRYVVNDSF